MATQLNKDNKIRVGKNGVLQSNSRKVKKWKNEVSQHRYVIESRIGANIATQLNKGNKIRVGKNGVLQSNRLKVNKWKNEVSPHRYVIRVS